MKLRIQNFRSLKNTGYIDIKPLTILVGKNSSGKSSFLRHFPMLKQSFQENTRTPLLLYGKYVDFGTTFKDIKPKFLKETDETFYSIGLSFSLYDLLLNMSRRGIVRIYSRRIIRELLKKNNDELGREDIKFEVFFIENKKQFIELDHFYLEFLNFKIKIFLKKGKVEKIVFNNEELKEFSGKFNYDDFGKLLPEFYIDEDKDFSNIFFNKLRIGRYLYHFLVNFLSDFAHSNTSLDNLESIIEDINLFNIKETLINSVENRKLNTLKEKFNNNISILNNLEKYYVMFFVFEILLPNLSYYIELLFKNVSYIAPLRATAERYYRIQSLAVNEVDPYGKNLPFFLGSLTETQLNRFQEWTEKNFNFKVDISRSEGHYSIKIIQENKDINLADMGFGYSQILPILVQIWYSSSGFEFKKYNIHEKIKEKIIVIEQPELHLHPEFQAKFAEALVKTIKFSKNLNLKIIVETHSDAFINRIGDCVLFEKISPDDVNVIIFDKKENGVTDIRTSFFDEEGYLKNWPVGFFTPKMTRCE